MGSVSHRTNFEAGTRPHPLKLGVDAAATWGGVGASHTQRGVLVNWPAVM